jgi:prophage regulatory protein
MRFLRLSEVRNRVGYGRATIYRLMAAGEFPRSYSLGARAVAWLESEIDAWIEGRVRSEGTASRAARLVVR